MRAVKLVIDFWREERLGRVMECDAHLDLVERLVLHAGALAETLATDATKVRVDTFGGEAGRRFAETGKALALLAEAAAALINADD